MNKLQACTTAITIDTATWAATAATLVMAAVRQTCHVRGSCSVMLTGGRSAARLYKAWAALPEFEQLRDIRFFFGDERCVPPDHPKSNYGLAMQTLFQQGVPAGCLLVRMEAEVTDCDAATQRYENLLPDVIDVLLLGVGEDGHIASLFPHSPALHETHNRVVTITSYKPPFKRITITPPVIQNAREVFVLALGEQKRVVYEEALLDPVDIDVIPVRLVLNRTWIFGD